MQLVYNPQILKNIYLFWTKTQKQTYGLYETRNFSYIK